VEADPKSTAAQLGLARALLKQEKLPEAAEHFRASGYRNGLLDVAALYEKAGMKAEAIGIYREFPENAAVRERLGQLLIDNKDAAGAIPNLEEGSAARLPRQTAWLWRTLTSWRKRTRRCWNNCN